MIIFDTHVHTEFSPDSSAPMMDMAEAAEAAGLKKIAFTDHADWLYPSREMQAPFNTTARRRAYENVCLAYEGKLSIIWGIELGITDDPKTIKKQELLLRDVRPDYIIGSLHDYKGEDFYYEPYYNKRDKQKAYADYFRAMLNCVCAAPRFDTLGHIDYIERYARYENAFFRYCDYADIIEKILETLRERGAAVEVNTAHDRYGIMRKDEPMLDIAARYCAMGGRVVVGSDAHTAQRVGAGFGEMERWLAARAVSV